MGHMRGLHDIKTHGTLAREGRLVSVAKNLHRINRSGYLEEGSWDGRVEHTVFKRGVGMRRPSRNLVQDFALEKKFRAAEIALVQECIAEMEAFANEGVPGALVECHRLRAKLSQLEST
ncbi:MAG: hypothetical protein WAP51_01325 [Candidatus Sungiibacteriota bacterium]